MTELTALIDEYIHDFRSILLRGSNELWLFPGETGGCKDAKTFSGQITKRMEKATGLFITIHQFRHAAAAIWLKYNPGDYETVRRILGHRNIQTTINFYCGLETMQANRDFGDLVRTLMAVHRIRLTPEFSHDVHQEIENNRQPGKVRSLPFDQWPAADQRPGRPPAGRPSA